MKNQNQTKTTARMREACTLLALLAVFVFPLLPTRPAQADGDAAKLLISSGAVVDIQPGEKKMYTVGFKNIGSETWTRDGANFVSVYTWEPKYRTSAMADPTWLGPTQPARLREERVAPGGVGFVSFALRGAGTPGTYIEKFHLAAEGLRWIPGGEITVTVRVGGGGTLRTPSASVPTASAPSAPSPAATPSLPAGSLSAQRLIQSAKELAFARGGDEIRFRVLFRNSGSVAWDGHEVVAGLPGVAIATAVATSDFRAPSWASSAIAMASGNRTEPGATAMLDFTVKAPQRKGSYMAAFHLQVDGREVPGSGFEIPATVTNDGPNANPLPPPPAAPAQPTPPSTSAGEPTMRVGVLIVDEETDWQVTLKNPAGFDVVAGASTVATVDGSGQVAAGYQSGAYWYDTGSGRHPSGSPLRFVPKSSGSIFTVTNFDRRVTRSAGYADNTFRDILELRWNPTHDRTWLINELGMESYLRGLAETSNISHLEFQKALITAARTYAYYHWERGTKHAAEGYHVDAYYDQVYKGYGQEERTPRLTQSVEATRGQIVTYEGRTAITPYFSRSDGRTRNWEEVWRSDPVAWLRGVPVPCDVGKDLWGHGVGMSASGALCMANEGKPWDEIVRYFYTGITLLKKW